MKKQIEEIQNRIQSTENELNKTITKDIYDLSEKVIYKYYENERDLMIEHLVKKFNLERELKTLNEKKELRTQETIQFENMVRKLTEKYIKLTEILGKEE